jgi:hypothetical protein
MNMYFVDDSMDFFPLVVEAADPLAAAMIADKRNREEEGIDKGPVQYEVYLLEKKGPYYHPASLLPEPDAVFLSRNPGENLEPVKGPTV